jgi:hypothetical protein
MTFSCDTLAGKSLPLEILFSDAFQFAELEPALAFSRLLLSIMAGSQPGLHLQGKSVSRYSDFFRDTAEVEIVG